MYAQPVVHDVQVVVLLERVERQPQAEALRERYFFFYSFARMDFAVGLVLGAEVFAHVFRHQMPAIRRGVDKQVLARGPDRAVPHRLQRLVARLAFLESQIVAQNKKALWPAADKTATVDQTT